MHHTDVKLAHLTRNLLSMAEGVASYTANEAERLRQAAVDSHDAAVVNVHTTPSVAIRGKAAVVAWDLGHNPVGRAYVLYQLLQKDWDVDLIGPLWSCYGDQVWEPLRGSNLNIRTFHCSKFIDFIPKAEALAATEHYDLVYVCKPRLPSLYLGALLKDASGCPLLLDVDDFELSFFNNETAVSTNELKADIHAGLFEPYQELGTRYAQSLIDSADAVTVSNVALRRRFGGHIVRHARDEVEFANSPMRRAQARARLGISESDFALVFIGTPRRHKGIVEVVRALNELKDPDIVFHIVGTITDEEMLDSLAGFSDARLVCHPNCSFDELPDLLAGADLVPLIQDVDHPISQYQIPAKISDALSLGIPVIATCTPPIADLIAAGIIIETDAERLAESIAATKTKAIAGNVTGAAGADSLSETACAVRTNFVNELGMRVNRARLELAIADAQDRVKRSQEQTAPAVSLFAGRRDYVGQKQLPPAWHEMVSVFRDHYRSMRKHEINEFRTRRGDALLPSKPRAGAKRPARRITEHFPSIIGSRSISYDMAFFWKQNDTSLYGRRSDMIAKGLAESGRVRKMIHFDAPVSASSLNQHFATQQRTLNGQQDLILRNLIDRQLGVYDTHVVRNRTHVYAAEPQRIRLLGEPLYVKGSYVRYVNEQLEESGMRASRTLAWFCPVIWDAPELIKQLGFAGVVADLIDDQRAWDGNPNHQQKLATSYRETLQAADIVFANCKPLAQAMQAYTPKKIHVVANGAERFDQLPKSEIPSVLQGIEGPIVGYVGNLRDRVDWTLLHEVVAAMPDISFVFFGPSNDNPNANSLEMYDNVHMLGVVAYDELPFYLQHIDVGLVLT